jgi:hypothetical protein
MKQQTYDLFKLVEKRAPSPQDAYPYTAGFMSSFLSHLERQVPGVADAIAQEIDRLQKEVR